VFAMGGDVVLAVNIAAFPEHFPREAIAAIFAAAAKVVTEAGGRIAGGHTIRNPEPIFGLAVQGVVHPQRIFRKSGAKPGDRAVLSKPLGSGLVTAAGTDSEKRAAIAGMRIVNRAAAEALRTLGGAVHAVTDVTGYGLAGHGWEMADRSGVRLVVHADSLATYDGARRIAAEGRRTGGDPRNRAYVGDRFVTSRSDDDVALLMDPQTSGGLLAAVDPQRIDDIVGACGFVEIGEFVAGERGVELI
jgi:selenide,water dikinase